MIRGLERDPLVTCNLSYSMPGSLSQFYLMVSNSLKKSFHLMLPVPFKPTIRTLGYYWKTIGESIGSKLQKPSLIVDLLACKSSSSNVLENKRAKNPSL